MRLPTPGEPPLHRLRELERRLAELERRLGNSGIIDYNGSAVAVPDPATGVGLGRPYLPVPFTTANTAAWGSTSSTTPALMSTSVIYKQHPKLVVQTSAVGGANDVAGVVQLKLNGTRAAPDITVGSASAVYTFGPLPAPGNHLTQVSIEVWAWRTAGTAPLYVTALLGFGVQT